MDGERCMSRIQIVILLITSTILTRVLKVLPTWLDKYIHSHDITGRTLTFYLRNGALALRRQELHWNIQRNLTFDQRLRRLNTKFYTDTLFTKVSTSLRGNTCAQIFTDGEGAIFAYPMWNKAEAREQLIKLCQQVGIPNELHRDGALEMRG